MKVAIIGGGPSGIISAITLAKSGIEVVLYEKNEKLGKKLYITGKGRCNITNDCEIQDFFDSVIRGKKFLNSAIYGFSPQDTMSFFEDLGLKLVVERGNRVFPLSQKSSDVIKVLTNALKSSRVQVRLNNQVTKIVKNDNNFSVSTAWEKELFDKVIIATGGVSYPLTGSTGDGYDFAEKLGHNIVDIKSGLAPIIVNENIKSMQGLSLKNVCLTAYDANNKIIAEEFGEMMFTDKALTGPIALTISSFINRKDKVRLSLDLKPALDNEKLDARILRDFEERKNQDLRNVTRALLPDRLNVYVISAARIMETKKVNLVTKEERAKFVQTIKNLPFVVKRLADLSEAIITSGGVDTKQLKPSMESKVVDGLYFVGEVVDIDALTGGFNLQLAYSTGMISAMNIIKLSKNV